MNVPEPVLTWLLEPADPSIRFRTLTELLDYAPDHPDVAAARAAIPSGKYAARILSQTRPDGEWPWIGSYDSPELGIGYLGELGLDRSHPAVDRAVQAFLAGQYPDGTFPNSYTLRRGPEGARPNDQSCYYALTIRGLLRLGYREDERLQKAIAFTLSQSRWDGGYLCTKSYVRESTKSCIRGSKNVLLLFAELPALWDTPQCQALVAYFLDRKVFCKRSDHTQFVRGHPATYYPFHYRLGVLEPLYALSKMGYGTHPAVAEAWGFLEEKRDDAGRYRLDWTMPQCAFNPGKEGEANKWVTLYAHLALKQRDSGKRPDGAG